MQLQLSWDLFILVFFAVIAAYSFIVGRSRTMKIILATYMAILAADGLGNLVQQYILAQPRIMNALPPEKSMNALLLFKILLFVTVIVLIAVKGEFSVSMYEHGSKFMKFLLTALFGLLSAGLIISTVLIYVSGISFVQGGVDVANEALVTIYDRSHLVKVMINNYDIWFSLPALAFIGTSLLGGVSQNETEVS